MLRRNELVSIVAAVLHESHGKDNHDTAVNIVNTILRFQQAADSHEDTYQATNETQER